MEFRSIAVVGGGAMGRGIARALAGAEIETEVAERGADAAEASRRAFEAGLDHEIARWSLTESEKRALLARVRWTDSIEALRPAALAIEAVDEDPALKRSVLARLGAAMPAEAVFVTNTSTLPLDPLAEASGRPSRFAGLHFVNPASRTPVVEVVRGLATADETVAAVKALAVRIGKTPIEVFDSPGFVTTRVMLPFVNEAAHVVMEGVASAEDVDQVMKFGYSLECGPLTLADRMGLDELLAALEHLFRELGDPKYRPCPLIRRLVRAGKLGVKTGEGFFRYDGAGQ